MLAGGETVLVGLSGGGDSVALLHLLLGRAPVLRLRLHALHVDHGLRPDSGQDAVVAQDVGRRLGVPVDVQRVTVPRGGSLEGAARAVRLAALEAAADRIGAHRIALGHTRDDQAETVLMRFLAGAGPRGLAGIPPVRGRLIRPLLDCGRAALRDDLRRAGLPWIEDPSNGDPKFLRNRVRHELLPWLATAWDPDVAATLVRVAALARETMLALEGVAAGELERHGRPADGALLLPLPALRALPPPLAGEVLRQAAVRVGGGVAAPLRAWAHRGLGRALATPPPRRPFRLGGVSVEASGRWLRLAAGPAPPLRVRTLAVPGALPLPEIGRTLVARIAPGAGYVRPRDPARAAFDADQLPASLVVRGRAVGDRLVVCGGGVRRLKSLFIDAKVPRWERARTPIIEASGRILWVAGLRCADAAPVGPATRRVLELTLGPPRDSAVAPARGSPVESAC